MNPFLLFTSIFLGRRRSPKPDKPAKVVLLPLPESDEEDEPKRKRFKKYERSARAVVINPLSESEEEPVDKAAEESRRTIRPSQRGKVGSWITNSNAVYTVPTEILALPKTKHNKKRRDGALRKQQREARKNDRDLEGLHKLKIPLPRRPRTVEVPATNTETRETRTETQHATKITESETRDESTNTTGTQDGSPTTTETQDATNITETPGASINTSKVQDANTTKAYDANTNNSSEKDLGQVAVPAEQTPAPPSDDSSDDELDLSGLRLPVPRIRRHKAPSVDVNTTSEAVDVNTTAAETTDVLTPRRVQRILSEVVDSSSEEEPVSFRIQTPRKVKVVSQSSDHDVSAKSTQESVHSQKPTTPPRTPPHPHLVSSSDLEDITETQQQNNSQVNVSDEPTQWKDRPRPKATSSAVTNARAPSHPKRLLKDIIQEKYSSHGIDLGAAPLRDDWFENPSDLL